MDNIVDNRFKVRVRSGDKELEINIPLSNRGSIGLKNDGTGRAAIKIVEELIEKINQDLK